MRDILERHIKFWERADVDEPLVGKIPTRQWVERPYPLKGGGLAHDPRQLTPENIEVGALIDGDCKAKPFVVGDLIIPLGPSYPEAWMESLIGCGIYVSAFGCAAKPKGVEIAETAADFSVQEAFDSAWGRIMDAVLARAVRAADGQLPVRQLHLRGVIDMLAAFLGEKKLCESIFDSDDSLSRLGDKFAELIVRAATRGIELRPAWQGGYVSTWKVYAPGSLIDYQVDASSLFSPRMYEQHFLGFDRQVLSQFEYSMLHTHSCGQHIIECLLGIEELRGIQVNLDRETGAWDKKMILDSCQKIQAASKCLMIEGELTEDELAEFKEALSPQGLAICYWNP